MTATFDPGRNCSWCGCKAPHPLPCPGTITVGSGKTQNQPAMPMRTRPHQPGEATMSTRFLPATAAIRECATTDGSNLTNPADFDRWLAHRDQQIAAAAWDRGFIDGIAYQSGRTDAWRNPYRTTGGQQ